MSNFTILIPTYGRPEKQSTWNRMPEQFKKHTRLVVSPDEAPSHLGQGRRLLVSPAQGKGMASLRQWMLEWAAENKVGKLLMMDDDLCFVTRREGGRILVSTPEEEIQGINWLINALDDYTHAAMSDRTNGWSDTEEYRKNTRGIQCVGYRPREVLDTGCRFNLGVPDWFFIEDYHMSLQLLEKGHENIVSRVHRYSFGPNNAKGGCSSFRNPETQKEAAQILERCHPGIVKAVEKTTKGSYGGGTRWDVRISWMKAAAAGRAFQEAQRATA